MAKLDKSSIVEIKLKPPQPDTIVLAVPFIRQVTLFTDSSDLSDLLLECRAIATSRGLTLTAITFAEAYSYDPDEGEYERVSGVHIYGKPDGNLAKAQIIKAITEGRGEGKLSAALRELV